VSPTEPGTGNAAERRHDQPDRPSRSNAGRRSVDRLPNTTITKKLLVVIVAAINAFYLVGEAFLSSNISCL